MITYQPKKDDDEEMNKKWFHLQRDTMLYPTLYGKVRGGVVVEGNKPGELVSTNYRREGFAGRYTTRMLLIQFEKSLVWAPAFILTECPSSKCKNCEKRFSCATGE